MTWTARCRTCGKFEILTRDARESLRDPAPRRQPHHGPGGAGAVPRHPGDHRPIHRRRLLLRLRPRRAGVQPGRPGGHRSQDEGDRRPRRGDQPRGLEPRRGDQPLQVHRRGPLQGRDHREHPRRRGRQRLPPGRLEGPLPGAALPVDEVRGEGVQADQTRRRLLAGRSPQRHAAAHLRHGYWASEEDLQRPTSTASRRPRSATTAQDRQGHGPLPPAGGRPRG